MQADRETKDRLTNLNQTYRPTETKDKLNKRPMGHIAHLSNLG
jgi:hypothetical protein